MPMLADYKNGNCRVQLFSDGTKVVDYDPPAEPEFPLSVDTKITDWCDNACEWCHENSSLDGKHADVVTILRAVAGLPPGTELAIGGGDPFAHPYLFLILGALKECGFVVNMTVNASHVGKHSDDIRRLRERGWLYGLGVSVSWVGRHADDVESICDDNTVLHVIVGLHNLDDVLSLVRAGKKVLVLGYKRHRRGADFYCAALKWEIADWASRTSEILEAGGHIAFDTLALEQLGVRSLVHSKVWEKHHMGDDGEFTMYVDAVRGTYGRSSTAPRKDIGELSIREMFADVRATRSA